MTGLSGWLAAMERVVKAATPGPWGQGPDTAVGAVWVYRKGEPLCEPEHQPSTLAHLGRKAAGLFHIRRDSYRPPMTDAEYWAQTEKDAEYIATFDPPTLRALLAVVRAADDWKTTRDAKIIADGVDFVMANERPSDARLQAHGEHMEASNRLEDALAALPTDPRIGGCAAGER